MADSAKYFPLCTFLLDAKLGPYDTIIVKV
jgi:hypothetical protein